MASAMKSVSVSVRSAVLLMALVPLGNVGAQLLRNLEAFGNSVSLIDVNRSDPDNLEVDGPKHLATADFDLDGLPDLAASKVFGKVAVVFGEGGTDFSPVQFLSPPADTGELRGITTADFNGDGRPDIAIAAPYSGQVVLFASLGNQTFGAPVVIEAWRGVRALLPLDLDGDGDQDLIAAGPVGDAHRATKAGVRPLINDGSGNFVMGDHLSLTGGSWRDKFPRPVFAMSALPSKGVGERAVVTHVNSSEIWILNLEAGNLVIETRFPALLPTRSLVAGPVLSQDGQFDLVQAARDENQILVRSGEAGAFSDGIVQRLYIPGAPRALALADVDADGWNDLLVVLRNYDRVVTFHNDRGSLTLAAEAPVGSSPRDLVPADFNGDGRIDLAVSNRRSDNISVLLTQADGPGFERLDSVYDVDGGVSGLFLHDLNGDGRDDVIQSHILTKEISVRMAGIGGVLGPAVYSALESPPVSFRAGDYNGDDHADLIVVHSNSLRPGLSVLFGDGNGGFNPPSFLPSTGGGLFSVIVADFDNDGLPDAAVGNYDCRLSMFKGVPGGGFEFVKLGLFTYEARAMMVSDFDDDGDLDLAGASANGSMTVVENDGTLLRPPRVGVEHSEVYRKEKFNAPAGKGRIKSMVIVDWNGDDDEDLAINSEDGVSIFLGKEGLGFEALPSVVPGTRGSSDLVLGDFDGDGVNDMATACRLLSCVVILKGQPGGGSFEVATVTTVPAADHIATGDIDGDGLADLAGSGEVLWVALSSRPPDSAGGSIDTSRPPKDAVVINEVLASNKTLLLLNDNRTPDAMELFNGRETVESLAGWKVVYQRAPVDGRVYAPVIYPFPDTVLIEPRQRIVLYCDDRVGYLHTNFKLAREGATLTLKDQAGTVIDSITYELQEAGVSLGRYTDGADLITLKEEPDIGAPNYTTVTIEPDFKRVSVVPGSLYSEHEIRPVLSVKAEDEVGIFTLTAVWQTLDRSHSGRFGLFDDGRNDDGDALDSWFAGKFPALPAGSKVEFFLQATNLIDEEETAPGDPVFSLPGLEVTNYAFTIPEEGAVPPTIEISEVQPHRRGIDGAGDKADYIEIRNTGDSAVPLEGLALRDAIFDSGKSHSLRGTLEPGEHRVYYANGTPRAGPNHIPFKLDSAGDTVWLVELDERGVATPYDRVRPPDDTGSTDSWARLGPGGEFVSLPATQGEANLPAGHVYFGLVPASEPGGGQFLRLGFPAPLGSTPVVESLAGASWVPEQAFTGNGFERSIDFPIDRAARLFRVRK